MPKTFIRDYIEGIRNKYVSVQRKSLLEVKREYQNMYHQALLQLWADSCILDPGNWSDEDMMRFRFDYKRATPYTSGRLGMEEDIVLLDAFREEYRYGLTESFADPSDLISYDESNWTRFGPKDLSIGREFYIAVYLRNMCKSLDELYENCNFGSNREKVTRSIKINYLSGQFITKSGVEITEAIARVYSYALNLKRQDLTSIYWSILYRELGIDEDTLDLHGPGLFLAGVSLKQERELWDLVINWQVDLLPKYGDYIKENNLRAENSIVNFNRGKFSKEFIAEHEQEVMEAILNRLNDTFAGQSEKSLVFISGNAFYYTEGVRESLVMSGQYTIDSVNGNILSVTSAYLGDTGEYVNPSDVDKARDELGIDLEFSGSPVIVSVNCSETPDLMKKYTPKKGDFVDLELYPVSQVKGGLDLHGGKTVFSRIIKTLQLTETSREELRNQACSADSLKDKIRSTIKHDEAGYYGPLRVSATRSEIREATASIVEEG